MSDILADAARREFENEDTRHQQEHYVSYSPVNDIVVCPCCNAKVRIVVERLDVDEFTSKLEFVSYKC